MDKDILYFKKQLRRMFSMTKKFRGVSVSLFVTLLVVSGLIACVSNNPITDAPKDTLVFPWELRDGTQSYIQLTNINTSGVVGTFTQRVHIQILDKDCTEIFNYFDKYTPGDTHLYNVGALDSNDGTFVGPPDLVGKAGFIAIQGVNLGDNNLNPSNDWTGEYRVVYAGGWEYRSNAAGFETEEGLENFSKIAYTFNFNDVNGTANADVPIAFLECTTAPAECAVATNSQFEARIFDDNENQVSCPTHNACGFFGINQAYETTIPDNETTGARVDLCNGTAPNGHVLVVATGLQENEMARTFRVGFVGLNDGGDLGGLGHMDVWNGVWDNLCTVVGNCPVVTEMVTTRQ